jgi:hypothetical protein
MNALDHYVTRIKNWDVSRETFTEDNSTFTRYYLHGTTFITTKELKELCDFSDFVGVGNSFNADCLFIDRKHS